MLQPVLAAMGILLLLATVYLSLSLIVLNLPRANFPVWFALLAAMLAVQGGLTLAAFGRQRTRGVRPPAFASLRRGAP